MIANNTGNNGGDDISFYGNQGGTLNLGDASQMNVAVTETDRAVTGWYQDALDNRWTPETAQAVDVSNPLSAEKYHLKAAHGKTETFSPVYVFISGTDGKQLPEEVMDLLPADAAQYEQGAQISAIAPKESTVRVTDGQWIFSGWDENSKISAEGVVFIGTWEFKANAAVTDAGNKPENKTAGGDTSSASPQTGDTANILLYAVLLSMSGIAGTGIYVYKREKRN